MPPDAVAAFAATLSPATEPLSIRREGVLISTTGRGACALKIRLPLPIGRDEWPCSSIG